MHPRQILLAAAAALCATAFDAAAAVGMTQLPGLGDDGPVTVFYPSDAPSRAVQRLGYTLQLAEEAAPAAGNRRLAVVSHGTGAPPWVYADLARALVEAGYVVAVPEHRGDHYGDQSKIGPESWRLRPHEVSRAIDAVLADPRFAGGIDGHRVGVFGFSAGGHTALTLAGGRWSAARMAAHCEAHLADDFAACTGGFARLTGGWLDGLKTFVARIVIRWRLAGDDDDHGHHDPRIGAVVAASPWAANFDPASLAGPRAPLALIVAPEDAWLRPRFHSLAVLGACPACERIDAPAHAGHGAHLSPFPHGLPDALRPLLEDPPGFDRAELPAMHRRIARFFDRHLGVERNTVAAQGGS